MIEVFKIGVMSILPVMAEERRGRPLDELEEGGNRQRPLAEPCRAPPLQMRQTMTLRPLETSR